MGVCGGHTMSLTSSLQYCRIFSYRYLRLSRDRPAGAIEGGFSTTDGDHTPRNKCSSSSSAMAVFLRKTTPGWYCLIPSRRRKWEERNPAQSREGTMVLPSWALTSWQMLHAADSSTTRAKSSSELTSALRNFLLTRPKQASGENFGQ